MTGKLSLSQSIVRAVCERDERPDPDHDDALVITADDLETIIDNHLERWVSTAFNMTLKEFQSRDEAARIADAVLSWLVKYDLADPCNEYRAADVIAIMDDFAPSPQNQMEGCEAEKIGLLEERIASFEDELYEARQVPWPEWSKEILKTLQKYGCDPVVDGEVDLGEAFKDYLEGVDQEDKAQRTDIERLRAEVASLKSAEPSPANREEGST